jgi:hypothetical protein
MAHEGDASGTSLEGRDAILGAHKHTTVAVVLCKRVVPAVVLEHAEVGRTDLLGDGLPVQAVCGGCEVRVLLEGCGVAGLMVVHAEGLRRVVDQDVRAGNVVSACVERVGELMR